MTITQLHTFLTICQSMSFTDAARRLFISQPAVSRQMAALETELGVRLFERRHNTLQLTDAGHYLNRNLPPVTTRLERLLDQTRRIGNGLEGELHIGLLEDQCLDPGISGALRLLRERHNVHLTIQRLGFIGLDAALDSGEIDVALSIDQGVGAFLGRSRYIYAQERMCLAIRRDLLTEIPTTLDDLLSTGLLSCPLLIPSLSSFQTSLSTALYELMKPEKTIDREYDFSSIAPMVAAGLGCTLANETHNLSVDQSVVLIPSETMPQISKGVFWAEDNSNPVIPHFLSCLKETLAHTAVQSEP